jgi:hypothetical protein
MFSQGGRIPPGRVDTLFGVIQGLLEIMRFLLLLLLIKAEYPVTTMMTQHTLRF